MGKLKYVLGIATIVGIGGFTAYAIKKAKDAKNQEGVEITLSEAKDILKKHQAEMGENDQEPEDPYAEIKAKVRAEIKRREKTVTIVDPDEEDTEDFDEDEDDEDEETYEEEIYVIHPKGDEELRHEPSSNEARDQFIRMELAEFLPLEDEYEVMLKLYEVPFEPKNDGDAILRTQILDYKVQFFGFTSKWVKDVTMADVIMHYARSAEFNCGENIRFWVEYFLEFNEFDYTRSSHEFDVLVERLNGHYYYNEERATFGLFGLTREAMDQAIRIASMNVDRSVTYEIEFNEFLKSCI